MTKSALILSTVLLGSLPAIGFAQAADAPKSDAAPATPAAHASCDEMKQRIASQIEGHGVKQYTLEIVDAASPGDGKVVAQCGSGKKAIVYTKGGAKADAGK